MVITISLIQAFMDKVSVISKCIIYQVLQNLEVCTTTQDPKDPKDPKVILVRWDPTEPLVMMERLVVPEFPEFLEIREKLERTVTSVSTVLISTLFLATKYVMIGIYINYC